MKEHPNWLLPNSPNGCADLTETPFWEKPVASLTREKWEALCDGCGKCCLHKVEDEDSGRIYPTNVACKLLDIESCRCADYRHRRMHVPDCIRLTPRSIDQYPWLPESCAYVLRSRGEPLQDWHYLVCGDRDAVHRAGISVKGRAVSELHAGPLENHIVEQPL